MHLPDWYWFRGLHDAKILSVLKKDIPWDPKQKIPDKNCLILKIDCDNALLEQGITEIRFYNFKILTTNFNLNDLIDGWWLSDELYKKVTVII